MSLDYAAIEPVERQSLKAIAPANVPAHLRLAELPGARSGPKAG